MPRKKKSPEDPSRLIGTTELAQLLNVGTTCATDVCRHGRVPCIRTPGGKYRIRYADAIKLRDYLRGGDGHPGAPLVPGAEYKDFI